MYTETGSEGCSGTIATAEQRKDDGCEQCILCEASPLVFPHPPSSEPYHPPLEQARARHTKVWWQQRTARTWERKAKPSAELPLALCGPRQIVVNSTSSARRMKMMS